jgi:hypothetical protein
MALPIIEFIVLYTLEKIKLSLKLINIPQAVVTVEAYRDKSDLLISWFAKLLLHHVYLQRF